MKPDPKAVDSGAGERGMFLRGVRRKWGFRRIRNVFLLALALWFVYAITVSDQGAFRIISLKNSIREAEHTLASLQAEQDSLERELSGLEENLDLVEKHAREELGMVRPGEVVYKLVPAPKKEADPAGKEGKPGESEGTPIGP